MQTLTARKGTSLIFRAAMSLGLPRLFWDGWDALQSLKLIAGNHEAASEAAEPVRAALRKAAPPMSPTDLSMKLRILASRESQRRRRRISWQDRWMLFRDFWRIHVSSHARPFAIPTAGGFMSALVMFGVLGPTLQISATAARGNDIPTCLYTEASVKNFMPLSYDEGEVMIEITVDGNGRLIDHSYVAGSQSPSPGMRKRIGNQLLLTEFNPATSFGRPLSGKLLIFLRNSRIDVKG